MGEVICLPGSSLALLGEPDPVVISILENLLDRARSGQLQSIIATGFCSDGARMAAFATDNTTNVYEMMGAISWLEHEYAERIARHNPSSAFQG
jgi:hypothetical protein